VPESASHIILVRLLSKWIAESLLDGEYGFILIDNSASQIQEKPPMINGYIPDIYVMKTAKCGVIIGEAKTSKDVERPHSLEQYEAFLRWCSKFDDSLLVLAVPWYQVRNVESILRRLKKKIGAEYTTTKVLERLPG